MVWGQQKLEGARFWFKGELQALGWQEESLVSRCSEVTRGFCWTLCKEPNLCPLDGNDTSLPHTALVGIAAAAAAKSLQSCPTLCNPTDGSPPGSAIPGILQARTLEWVAISFSSAWKGKVKVKLLSHIQLFVTPWTAAYQAPPSMGFSRQEYWSGVPLSSPGGHWTHHKVCFSHSHWTMSATKMHVFLFIIKSLMPTGYLII